MQTCLTGAAKTVSTCVIKLWQDGSYALWRSSSSLGLLKAPSFPLVSLGRCVTGMKERWRDRARGKRESRNRVGTVVIKVQHFKTGPISSSVAGSKPSFQSLQIHSSSFSFLQISLENFMAFMGRFSILCCNSSLHTGSLDLFFVLFCFGFFSQSLQNLWTQSFCSWCHFFNGFPHPPKFRGMSHLAGTGKE